MCRGEALLRPYIVFVPSYHKFANHVLDAEAYMVPHHVSRVDVRWSRFLPNMPRAVRRILEPNLSGGDETAKIGGVIFRREAKDAVALLHLETHVKVTRFLARYDLKW